MKFRKFIGYRPVMRVLLLLILVTITDTFTISSSSGSCNIDGQPVLWDGENVDMACSIDITGAFELVISKSSPAQNLFTYTLPSTTTIQGDFTGRVSNEVVASTGVSFTVSSFTSTDSSPYTCTPQNTTGGYSTTVDLTGRIFTKPSSSSIPLTTKVDGTTVSDGDTIGQSSDVTINLETSSVSGSPVPTLSVTRDGNSVTCTQTSLTSTARACQATISSTDLQSSSQIVTSAVLCDVSNTISLTSECDDCVACLVLFILASVFCGPIFGLGPSAHWRRRKYGNSDKCFQGLFISYIICGSLSAIFAMAVAGMCFDTADCSNGEKGKYCNQGKTAIGWPMAAALVHMAIYIPVIFMCPKKVPVSCEKEKEGVGMDSSTPNAH